MILSFVAPCRNEAANISELVRRCISAAEKCNSTAEIILVDDGSIDQTWREICLAAGKNSQVHGIRLSRNFGHQIALSAGLEASTGDYVLSLDADLQDAPEYVFDMLQIAQNNGADVVFAVRRSRKGVSFLHRICYSSFYRLLSWLAETPVQRNSGDFRLLSRRIVSILIEMTESRRFVRGMIGWMGFNQISFEYDREARSRGLSSYSWTKLFDLAANGIVGFSIRPLRFSLGISGALALSGFISIFYILFTVLKGESPPPGWASLMVVILFTSSLQTLVLGIIGEYLGRTFEETKRRPLYLVSEKTP